MQKKRSRDPTTGEVKVFASEGSSSGASTVVDQIHAEAKHADDLGPDYRKTQSLNSHRSSVSDQSAYSNNSKLSTASVERPARLSPRGSIHTNDALVGSVTELRKHSKISNATVEKEAKLSPRPSLHDVDAIVTNTRELRKHSRISNASVEKVARLISTGTASPRTSSPTSA